MSYGLYPELFGEIEQVIETGLYEQAEDLLKNIKNPSLLKEHTVFAQLLTADIYSRQGRFPEALALQKNILKKPPESLLLREAVLHSYAYAVGYSGSHAASFEYFEKAQSLSKRFKDAGRYYASVIGSIDIEFHDYSCNRFLPEDNVCLLTRMNTALREIQDQNNFQRRDFYVGQFSFRKAILLWLQGNYAEAKPLFETTRKFSNTFFSTWALFGTVNCMLRLGGQVHLQKRIKELEIAEKKPACKKNAMKYWPVALLLGRTWELLGNSKKAHDFYRTILLIARNGYTNQKAVSSEYAAFITNFFYPVYQETVKHFIEVSHEYRYALNRAELFRARFLTEEYKRRYRGTQLEAVLTPNARIDEIGKQLSSVFNNDPTILYCFDFKDSGVLLLSRNLGEKYDRFSIAPEDYGALKRLAVSTRLTKDNIGTASAILKNALDAVSTARLLIIPHGIFNSIPFHALWRKKEPLISRTLVSYWPSLQMAALGETGLRPIPRTALFIGTKGVPASILEIQQLSNTVGNAQQLHDPSLPELKQSLLSSAGITHFVTHGKVRRTKNDLTIMRFCWGDFQLSHINVEISAISPVVVLNVCYGGHMIHDSGEFLKGLPVTLFQKGALTLLVSSCEVEQEASRIFYKRFYGNLFDGLTLGESYRKAILNDNDLDRMLANAPRIMGTCDIKISRC